MSAPIYGVTSAAAVALVAATPKTVLAAIAHANSGLQTVGFDISFNGVTATEVPVLVEICQLSGATAGTSTAATIVQESGLVLAAGFTAAYAYSVEPTVLTVMRKFWLTPNGGTVLYDFPLGNEPQCGFSPLGLALRCTAPAAANAQVTMRVQRI